MAFLFNIGIILAGILYIPFMIGLGLYMENIAAKVASLIGVFTSISILFVGIYPMNYITEHGFAALSFFFSGVIMVLVWTVAVLIQKKNRAPNHSQSSE